MTWTVFRTISKCYLYDRNINSVVEIPESDYIELNSAHISENLLEKYRRNRMLENTQLQEIRHGFTDLIEDYLEERMEQLVLQVTQQCNLRCEYCTYTDNEKYNNRTHANKFMSFYTAKRGIDFLMSHSKRLQKVMVGFYGGEPLLAIGLIQQVIAYIEENYPEKDVSYAMTTNGTLLNKEIVNYLVEKDIILTVSLDGPKELHDYYRKFRDGRGSFDIIMKNLYQLEQLYPDYFRKCQTNTVLTPDKDVNCTKSFLLNESVVAYANSKISLLSDAGATKPLQPYDEQVLVMQRENEVMQLLAATAEMPYSSNFSLFGNILQELERISFCLTLGPVNYRAGHPGGPCLAGSKRAFLDIDGTFYPCEKVSEIPELSIGSLEGFDIAKIQRLLNIGQGTEKECRQCWAFLFCGQCVASMLDAKGVSDKKRLSKCDNTRSTTRELLISFMALKESKVCFDNYT